MVRQHTHVRCYLSHIGSMEEHCVASTETLVRFRNEAYPMDGRVAQLEEHLICTQEAKGSIPFTVHKRKRM